jgi:hypothetical protein
MDRVKPLSVRVVRVLRTFELLDAKGSQRTLVADDQGHYLDG